MRIKRSCESRLVVVSLFFLCIIFFLITRYPESKIGHKYSLVLQAEPFDDKDDSSFDKFRKANDLLHGKTDEKSIKDIKVAFSKAEEYIIEIEFNLESENDEVAHNKKDANSLILSSESKTAIKSKQNQRTSWD